MIMARFEPPPKGKPVTRSATAAKATSAEAAIEPIIIFREVSDIDPDVLARQEFQGFPIVTVFMSATDHKGNLANKGGFVPVEQIGNS